VNPEDVRHYLLGKPEAYEDFPFGPDVAVIKVGKKMFATFTANQGRTSMNLKCDPDEAVMLRDIFTAVLPGYHMNKRHWNTIVLEGSIPRGELERMFDNSYSLVVRSMPRTERLPLEVQYGKELLYT